MANKKIKITDPTRILTLANLISLMRALLGVPLVYSMQNPGWQNYTFFLILIIVLSDAADGWVARRAHAVTHMGKWLDPAADFAVILFVSSYLVLVGKLPGWFYIFYLVRFIAIAIPAIYFMNHTSFVLSSNWWGKWAIGISTAAIFVHIFPVNALPWLPNASLYVASILLLVSWVQYLKTFYNHYRIN
ncbi:MAG: CDP-alcohol phosphatidyltransferase family protein [Candidatus Neomarinimicrobiota bacterium]